MKHRSISYEVLAWFSTLAAFMAVFHKLLVGESSFVGDSLNFAFPYFSYFAESILNGHFPYWDPFTHGGHPFFPMIGHNRLLDPTVFLVVGIGRFFTRNLLTLFNWNVVVLCLVAHLGIYLNIRKVFQNLIPRLLVIPILVFSTITFSSFWHVAALFYFAWVPIAIFYLNRLILDGDYRWKNWLLFGMFFGIQAQGYFVASLLNFLLFYFIALLLFNRDKLLAVFLEKENRVKFLTLFFLIFFMLGQTAVLFFYKDRFIFPYRMRLDDFMTSMSLNAPAEVKMPYSYLAGTGAFSNPWNFLWLVYPNWWGRPSEVFLSIGALPFVVALIGIFFGEGREKKLWLVNLAAFSLLILGPSGGLHRILFSLYPPISFIRHLMELSYFVLWPLFYFFALGCNVLVEWLRKTPSFNLSKSQVAWGMAISLYMGIGFCYLLNQSFPNQNFPYFIGALILTLVIAGNKLGSTGGFLSAFFIPCIAIVYYAPDKFNFLVQLFVLVGLPSVLLLVLKGFKLKFAEGVFYFVLGGSITGGAWLHLYYYERLYSQDPHLKEYGARIESGNTNLELTREVSPFGDLHFEGETFTVPALVNRKISLFNHNSSPSISLGLQKRILSHYIMYKDCFRLLRSGISAELIAELFSIKAPLFQYRQGYDVMEPDAFIHFLKNNSGEAKALLKSHFITTRRVGLQSELDTDLRSQPSVHVDSYLPNEALITIKTDRPGFVYWADGFDKDWKATVNGKTEDVLQANLNFKAIAIGTGTNSIHFWYFPWLYALSLYAYWVGIGLVLLVQLASIRIPSMFRRLSLDPKPC